MTGPQSSKHWLRSLRTSDGARINMAAKVAKLWQPCRSYLSARRGYAKLAKCNASHFPCQKNLAFAGALACWKQSARVRPMPQRIDLKSVTDTYRHWLVRRRRENTLDFRVKNGHVFFGANAVLFVTCGGKTPFSERTNTGIVAFWRVGSVS